MANLRSLAKVILLILSISVFGCSPVTTKYPLAQPKLIEKERFEGNWLANDAGDRVVVSVEVSDDGIGNITTVILKGRQSEFIRGEMVVAEGKQHNYISFRFGEEGKMAAEYYMARYKFIDNEYLLLWLPNLKTFEEAINSGRLQGKVTTSRDKILGSTSVHLTNPSKRILDFLDDSSRTDQFNYTDPVILRRMDIPKK